MGMIVKLTKLPNLDSVVIKQSGGRLFISAVDSIIIDKSGLLELIGALVKIGFIDKDDLKGINNEN